MSSDDNERRILSRKELAKEQRREAYQKAKQQRATDPRHLAQKEAAKVQRRATYQKLKQGRAADANLAQGKSTERTSKINQRVLASEVQSRHVAQGIRAEQNEADAQQTQTRETSDRAEVLSGYVMWGKASSVLN